MTSINATNARKTLYQLINEVNDTSTPITITNAKGKNAILIGEEDWNALQETLFLNAIPGLAESIIAADQEELADMETFDPDEEW